MKKYRGAIFDLDGVLVDTARYHYLAWKKLADQLEIPFTPADNERLKGVSRLRSLEIVLSLADPPRAFTQEERDRFAQSKNQDYLGYIATLTPADLLPGARSVLDRLRALGVGVALGSASKNALGILEGLRILDCFDAIVDGNSVGKAKPDPEVFLLAARELGLDPANCVVFEDARAGLQAARTAGMLPLGIGEPRNLPEAFAVYPDLAAVPVEEYF